MDDEASQESPDQSTPAGCEEGMSSRVAILHFRWDRPGGAEQVAAQVIEAFVEAGADVTIFTNSPEEDVRKNSMVIGTARVVTLGEGPRSRFNLIEIVKFDRLCRRYDFRKFDVVFNTYSESNIGANSGLSACYIHFPIFSTNVMDHAYLRGRSTIGGADLSSWVVTAALRLFRSAPRLEGARVFTNSRWTAQRIAEQYRKCSEIKVCYPPVYIPGHSGSRLPNKTGPLTVVALGRIAPSKRLMWLIRQIDLAAENMAIPVHFVIAGRAAGSYAEKVRRAASRARYARVDVQTELSDAEKQDLLRSADLGVHGFATEHFGIAIAEMMTYEVPVLVPDDGGQVELVSRSELRFRNGAELRSRLCALAANEGERRQLGAWAKKRVAELRPGEFKRRILEGCGPRWTQAHAP